MTFDVFRKRNYFSTITVTVPKIGIFVDFIIVSLLNKILNLNNLHQQIH